MTFEDTMMGCLLGTAVGDALGLPAEGLSARRQAKMFPRLDRNRLFGGRGLVSDDTEHAVLTLLALRDSQGEEARFRALMRRGLRRWFWTLPPGIGWGTLRAGLRLSMGLSRSGVNSAGNGPAMRAPIIAAWCETHAPDRLEALLRISTEVTHTDPRAFLGSLVLARLTGQLMRKAVCKDALLEEIDDPECRELVEIVFAHRGIPPQELCAVLGYRDGVSGYIYHTMAVVLGAALRADSSLAESVSDTFRCGGDCDSTAALVGGILGAARGPKEIPPDWFAGLRDWPLSGAKLCGLAERSSDEPAYLACLVRNLLLGPIFLVYASRRLLPPY